MAKASARPSPKKGKPSSKPAESLPIAKDVLAYVLLVFVAIALLALVSRGYGGGQGNWMGPYLGEALALNLGLLFGKIPTLFLLIAVMLTGLRLLLGMRVQPILRIALGFWSLWIFMALLLTLRIADLKGITSINLEMNGGMLGVFLVRQVMEPAFGLSRVVPALICGVGVVLTAIFAFGLRSHHIAPALTWLKDSILRLNDRLSRPRVSVPSNPTIEMAPSVKVHRNEDTSDFPILRKGAVRPYDPEELQAPPAAPVTPPVSPQPLANPTVPTPNPGLGPREAQLLNAKNLDPLELRRIREELADLRRAAEINNWEDRKEELKIEGIVKPSPPATAPVGLPSDDRTVKAVPAKSVEKILEKAAEIPITMPKVEPKIQPPVNEDILFGEHSGDYRLPKVGVVLATVPDQPIDYSQDELKQLGTMLEQQLENFRVKGKVVHIATGPVITRFEIEPGPGVKVSRFSGLSDDLALALKGSIRVIAPIPGKSVVGIEIPNRKAQTVYCREILESPRFMPDPYTLQIVLGKDIMGNAFVMDLARAPHLLIAGQTGSGKSVCINTLMASLLFSKTPDDLRMILVDPKVVELKSYENIPHLLHPVVTDPGTAVQALQWACFEMDRRYDLLAKAGVRNISGFNQKLVKGELDGNVKIESKDKQRMPFIVIVVDEFADVIMQAKKEFEDPVIRLAQKARAAGMHMVLATQRPSTNVITGIIKANLPTRISFKVASHIDARTVLDHAGAEKLLGRGDMLFRSIDDPEPIRVHGAFLTDNDAEKVALACSEQDVHYPQLSSFVIASPDSGGSEEPDDGPAQDELFWDAVELCVLQGGGSTSLLQRRFSIGYSRAGRLMDQIFRAGYVGPERGSKPREVLISQEELGNIRRTRGV